MTTTAPVIYDLADNGESTGTVYFFCSERCRSQSPHLIADASSPGENPAWCVPDGTICEVCHEPLIATA